uniref:Uncharacterized protein n=1 Tax=Pristionchus pacificus TaxID=54126 RepID=A0A2A6B4L8_PRIPA|eukprot:PDM60826.1 hypothetical protein PRIPAC_54632 [Pristionchus pacificus]
MFFSFGTRAALAGAKERELKRSSSGDGPTRNSNHCGEGTEKKEIRRIVLGFRIYAHYEN